MAAPTLVDVAKFSPLVKTELIDQTKLLYPEFTTLPWKVVSGYTYLTLKRTANPTVGFRAVNSGAAVSKSTYTNTTITCAVLDPRIEVDVAAAKACVDGEDVWLANELEAHFNAAVGEACEQLWYGTSNDANGFVGIESQVDSNMVIDAGGTTATTGSSCYVLGVARPDYLTWVLGGDGTFEISEFRKEGISDGTNRYTAYVADMSAWVGCQLGHAYSVVRIRDLTADSGKGLTDALIIQAMGKLRAKGIMPTHIYASARSIMQLQASRTATSPTGAPAPIPEEVLGVPLYMTNAIKDVEALS